MALKRSDVRKIIENAETSSDEKIKAILDLLHTETDALQSQLDEANSKLNSAEKERDAANTGKQDAEKKLADYKAEQKAKSDHSAKAEKFRALLKKAGVLDKYIDDIVSDSRKGDAFIRSLELDDDGGLKDEDAQLARAKSEFSGKIGTRTTKGIDVATPPAGTPAKMSRKDIINIKDASDRQAAIAANMEAFGYAAKE